MRAVRQRRRGTGLKRPEIRRAATYVLPGLFSVFSEAPVNYVRYRSPLKSREFDLYMPPELFGDQSRPERIWITLEKPEGVRTIQGFSQLPHRWSGPPGTVEFSVYDRSLEGKGSNFLLNNSSLPRMKLP